jgi:homogentisate 1,2-dioxygenase
MLCPKLKTTLRSVTTASMLSSSLEPHSHLLVTKIRDRKTLLFIYVYDFSWTYRI